MKQAKLTKQSREEINKTISEIKAKIAETERKVEGGATLTEFGKYSYESCKKHLSMFESYLKATEDEFIYTFKGVVVNDVLPEVMKF